LIFRDEGTMTILKGFSQGFQALNQEPNVAWGKDHRRLFRYRLSHRCYKIDVYFARIDHNIDVIVRRASTLDQSNQLEL